MGKIKNIFVSWDIEGPFGMYTHIKSDKDLIKYRDWEDVVKQIINIHKYYNFPLSAGILGAISLDCYESLSEYISFYPLNHIPKKSLIYKLNHNSDFRELVIRNQELFFKGGFLKNIFESNKELLYIMSHGFSHIHLREEYTLPEIIKLEFDLSRKSIENIFNDINVNGIILPRNQSNEAIYNILNDCNYTSLRESSVLKNYSENHSLNIFSKYLYKIIRKYDRFNLPFSNYILTKSMGNGSMQKKFNNLTIYDSGMFLPIPSSMITHHTYFKSFVRYVENSIKNRSDISIWLHPHNFLGKNKYSMIFYEKVIKYLSCLKSDYSISQFM
tara:strand:- start:11558 stop:12544 length:987 start_codon:yes stop_codon:yes gene_type:complete